MPKLRHVAFAAAALSIAVSTAATAQTAQRPELKVGNTWTSQWTGPGFTRVETQTVTEVLAAGGYRLTVADKGDAKERPLRLSADLNPMVRNSQDADKLQEFIRLSWPLEPGKSWSFPMAGNTDAFKWEVKAEGWETVTVPAGTFKALKLSLLRSGGRTPGSEEAWYAPEAKGIVKRQTHYSSTERRNAIDNTTIELTSYKID